MTLELRRTVERHRGKSQQGIRTSAASGSPNKVQLFRSDCLAVLGEDSGLVALAVSYTHTVAAWRGTFELVATASFASGGVLHTVEFDVPATGAVLALPASDGLTVDVRAEGNSEDARVTVSGTIASVAAAHPRPVTRTIALDLPTDSGVATAIPAFARGVWIGATSIGGAAGTILEFLSSPTLPTVLAQHMIDDGLFLPVPNGAHAFRLDGASATAIVRTIWELAP